MKFIAAFAFLLATYTIGAALAADAVPPLVAAAEKDDVDQVRRLLANGADPNARDSDNLTALNWAAYNGHLAVVQVLRMPVSSTSLDAFGSYWRVRRTVTIADGL